ncbi:hypothetical protein FH972_025285 [Carpinus fangiana]|uniref:Uncharacterized protein n=1 Tax=Carpinus fangiana TaxID=176857 RepID=A0A5N6L0Q5_9ROSI|nr:hypothetical protein FH972_025285 [Carpinus fangiana]QHR90790.1 hypothetical protein Q903MT_gene4816 [Picea sitchensis]
MRLTTRIQTRVSYKVVWTAAERVYPERRESKLRMQCKTLFQPTSNGLRSRNLNNDKGNITQADQLSIIDGVTITSRKAVALFPYTLVSR